MSPLVGNLYFDPQNLSETQSKTLHEFTYEMQNLNRYSMCQFFSVLSRPGLR